MSSWPSYVPPHLQNRSPINSLHNLTTASRTGDKTNPPSIIQVLCVFVLGSDEFHINIYLSPCLDKWVQVLKWRLTGCLIFKNTPHPPLNYFHPVWRGLFWGLGQWANLWGYRGSKQNNVTINLITLQTASLLSISCISPEPCGKAAFF